MALTKSPGAWTYNDLLALPDDGTRYEIIDGELYEMPAPSVDHQQILVNLIALLAPLVRALGGRLLAAPLDVFFPGADPVEPDVVILLPGWPGSLPQRGPIGAPDIVIEILSPSSRVYDRVAKRNLYARGGVREYWIVDPQARTVEVLTLDGGRYRSALSVVTGEAVTSPVLGDAVFSLTEVFAGIDEETA